MLHESIHMRFSNQPRKLERVDSWVLRDGEVIGSGAMTAKENGMSLQNHDALK